MIATLRSLLAVLACSLALPALAAFTDHGDGTVTDSATGLMWDKCSWGQTGSGCSGSASLHDWSAALGIAITANTASHKGYSDWRLPNKNELESLIDLSRSSPAIDTSAFPNTPYTGGGSWWGEGGFWTSTTYAPDSAGAWGVDFDVGLTYAYGKTDSVYVRLVRSGQSFGSFDSMAVAADTVPDAFSFTDQTGVALSTVTESNTITVAGINSAASISVSGGEYRINGGSWTSVTGTVSNGNTVQVRHTSAGSNSTTTNTTLTIGGVSDTFSTTTLALVGACGSANGGSFGSAPTSGLCAAGTASGVSGSGPWSWSCVGSSGGTTASCSANMQTQTVANGVCGSSNGGSFGSAPTSSLCAVGTASGVSGSGPWSWSCAGSNGGTTASCSANMQTQTAANGVCGSSNGESFDSAPTSSLCSAGMASGVSGSGPWSWSCTGSNGGTTASCLANVMTNASCGSSNGGSFGSAPTGGLCAAGTPSDISGNGPWYWSCTGGSGGTVSCAANPSGDRFTPTADFTDSGNGTVTHKLTGLIWQRCAMGQTWTGSTCSGSATTYSFDQARALTSSLDGHTDWRLPTPWELASIVDYDVYRPAINAAIFPDTSISYFWTDSSVAYFSGNAWFVSFAWGIAGFGNRSENHSVRLMRGGPSSASLTTPTADFIDNGDGTVTHRRTNLSWKRCAEGQTWSGATCTGTAGAYTYDQAVATTTSFAGKNDWRAPSVEELLSIAEYGAYDPAVNQSIFPNTPGSNFWSGSPVADGSDTAWRVDFYGGAAGTYSRSSGYRLRLVRGGQSSGSSGTLVVSGACGSSNGGSFGSAPTSGLCTAGTASGVSGSGPWSWSCAGSNGGTTASCSANSTGDRFTPTADFTDGGNGTVTHKLTGLVWQRCAVGQTWTGSTCSGTAATYSFDQALALTSSLGGYSDWRLPTVWELTSIVDYDKYEPAINGTIFPSTPSSSFWANSPDTGSSSHAWSVLFSTGYANSYGLRSSGYSVRLVRGRQSSASLSTPTADFIDNGDGTVTHRKTNLSWKRCAEGQTWSGATCTGTAGTYTYDQAVALTTSFAGKSDWRAPSVEELLSIVEYGASNPAVNQTIFSNTPNLHFWTSSPYAYYPSFAWFVYFGYGDADGTDRGSYRPIRLVRGTQTASSFAFAASNTVSARANASGGNASMSLSVDLSIDAAVVGQSGSVYLAALFNGQWFLNNGTSWSVWSGGALPAYFSGTLPASLNLPVVTNTDVRGLVGVQVYVGYGRDADEMLAANRVLSVHTVR